MIKENVQLIFLSLYIVTRVLISYSFDFSAYDSILGTLVPIYNVII